MSDTDAAIQQWTQQIHHGDALDILDDIPANSVHAVVTDPPYGLAFMGRDWDDFEPREYQEWCEDWATKAKRVLKPGGHLLAFSGTRTHHRLFSGVEDAGLEIRDTVTWHYGTGFPKALDVSKAIDKQAGEEREVVGTKADQPGYVSEGEAGSSNTYQGGVDGSLNNSPEKAAITAPATDAAEKWRGWKTGLKPATEFGVVARAPLAEDTVAENVLEHGTGAYNIDRCRIEYDNETDLEATRSKNPGRGDRADPPNAMREGMPQQVVDDTGRYPANVVFDGSAAVALDRHSGTASGTDDPDGPSRYFYTSKASPSERTEGGAIENSHPTVKPLDLMEWLVKLVSREGQVVLDPFAGTGTTLMAAMGLGREWIGVEKDAKWADVARVRCGLSPVDPSHVRSDDAQQGIESFVGGEDGE